MTLKPGPNALKRHPNGLKPARNRVKFRQNEAIFPRKWLKGNGLPLWLVPTIIKLCSSQDLQPIMVDDMCQSICNTLSIQEMRQTTRAEENSESHTKYNNTTEPDSIVTGGSYIYLYTLHELMDYRGRFFPVDVQKQRVFQAKVEVAKKEKKKLADPRKNHGKTRLSKFYRDRSINSFAA